MAFFLHIETATPTCSVAVSQDEKILAMRESHVDKSHASLLTGFIAEVLSEANLSANQLDAVSVSKGPGSYTGLRIGVATAKGLAYGLNIPLLATCTLEIMASGFSKALLSEIQQSDLPVFFCPMIDARRMEVFTSLLDDKLNLIEKTRALIIEPDSFKKYLTKGKVWFFGTGAAKCESVIIHKNAVFVSDFQLSASFQAPFANRLFKKEKFEDVAYFEPFYLKDFVATIPRNKILGGL